MVLCDCFAEISTKKSSIPSALRFGSQASSSHCHLISILLKGGPKPIVSTPLWNFLVLYFQLVKDFQYGYVESTDVPGK